MKTRSVLLSLLLIFGLSCGDTEGTLLEEVEFHLDRGEYSLAIDKAQRALEINPDSVRAKFFLATASIGQNFLGEGRTYLGLIADYARAVEAGNKRPLRNFLLVGGTDLTEAIVQKMEEAQDLLLSIPLEGRSPDIYLQIYVVRIFEIAVALGIMGVLSDDEVCNANQANANRDGVPDKLLETILTKEQAERLRDNLKNTKEDGERAGFVPDFELSEQIDTASQALETAIEETGDVVSGTNKLINDHFENDGTENICVIEP